MDRKGSLLVNRTVSSLSYLVGLATLGALAIAVPACEEATTSTPDPDAGVIIQPPPDAGPEETCPVATGPTMHKGDVNGEEVWTAEGSPHIVENDVSVRNSAKLTIEPCAVVQLAKGKHIHVAYPGTPNSGGTLIAEGTAKRPIRFEGYNGETWASIYAHAPGTVRLAYVTLTGGGGGDFEDHATIDILGSSALPADPILFVDHVTIEKSVGTGVWMQRHSTFIEGSRDLTITGSGNDDHPFPIQIEEHAIDALPTGKYTGNKIDEILLRTTGHGVAGSGLAVDATLHERGVPYRMGKSKLDDFIVGPSGDVTSIATLTIEPGVTMRFEKETSFRIQSFVSDEPARGVLRAIGTADKPIVFTSASATPAPGDWQGLRFGGIANPNNKLEHVKIEYAGFDCSCSFVTCSTKGSSDGAIIFTRQPPSAFVTNSLFKDIEGHAVTQGFDGALVNFRPTNRFENVGGCPQSMPRSVDTTCPNPKPECDGMDE